MVLFIFSFLNKYREQQKDDSILFWDKYFTGSRTAIQKARSLVKL